MARVIVYTLTNCPTSEKAIAALRERGVDFEERRVDENPQWWEEALQYAVTVPIIIWGEGDVEIGWEGEHG
ncbi:MAG: glutaredoxin [Dehalococcoidia bacterium]|jgi:glutaredoxin|nr:glutaredoxin [Dehalococcoidia bacterium]MDW8009704.1 glutaredoxin domain-containing protein [Chloroflexota bacterium]HXG41139.1 glutaredoxin domain-containing protein [Dehalococcoidia bacterium]